MRAVIGSHLESFCGQGKVSVGLQVTRRSRWQGHFRRLINKEGGDGIGGHSQFEL